MTEKKLTLQDALHLLGAQHIEPENETTSLSVVSENNEIKSSLQAVKKTAPLPHNASAEVPLANHLENLRPHVERVLQAAYTEAGSLIGDTQTQAEKILRDANLRSHQIIQSAHQEADNILAKKMHRAAEAVDTIYAHADAIAQASVNDPTEAYRLLEIFRDELVAASEKAAAENGDSNG